MSDDKRTKYLSTFLYMAKFKWENPKKKTVQTMKKKLKKCARNWAAIAQSVQRDSVRAGRSGDRILVGAKFSTFFHTGPRTHPTSSTVDDRSLFGRG